MPKKILIVDDDRILLSLTETKLKKHADNLTVLTAEDGLQAVAILKENHISLVVTDLHMPKMDGFALLAYLSENYPDIPVIILTAYSSPASKKVVLEGGAAGYMEKPFVFEDLAQKIMVSLDKEAEGGTLQTVPLDMFLQLVEMEQKTCTIRVFNKSSAQKGVLFFKNGDLYDARIRDSKGLPAAYEIFSWDKVTLSIQDTCPLETKQINDNLKTILMQAMRLKDEGTNKRGASIQKATTPTVEPTFNSSEPIASTLPESTRSKLEKMKEERKWLKEIFQDDSWNNFISEAIKLGRHFNVGTLKSCYLNKGEAMDLIILPDKKPTVISVDARCPRDKIMQILSQ